MGGEVAGLDHCGGSSGAAAGLGGCAAFPGRSLGPEVVASGVCPEFVSETVVFHSAACQIPVFSKCTPFCACSLCGHVSWEEGSACAAVQEASSLDLPWTTPTNHFYLETTSDNVCVAFSG